ncbi:MAG TPA: YceI family protein [Actinomycetota bacterium]|nr:YceI family protein [Actinomycetota bacterium]
MSTELSTRPVNGLDAPVAGTWTFDKAHTTLMGEARHLMVTKVRGRFAEFEGTIHVAEVPEDSFVEVEIQAASIDTGNPDRDAHLRSPDFLDVEQHPSLTFRSTGLELGEGPRFRLPGELTIRGVTRPVVLDAEFLGVNGDPWGNTRVGFSATTEIDREEFGMTWNAALETGGVLVSKTVKIELDVQAVAQQAATDSAAA